MGDEGVDVGDERVAPVLDVATARSLQGLLEQWQLTGSHEVCRHLLAQARPIVERVAAHTLRLHGIRDPATVDDAVALVFDHLRRLHGWTGERRVSPFVAREAGGTACGDHGAAAAADQGAAFIVRLSRDRALDVAKAHRRRTRRCASVSQLDAVATHDLRLRVCGLRASTERPLPAEDAAERLHAAIERLEPRHRTLVTLLLEGKNQAVIAHVLGVCEGTVSRIRRQAIDQLRSLLDETSAADDDA